MDGKRIGFQSSSSSPFYIWSTLRKTRKRLMKSDWYFKDSYVDSSDKFFAERVVHEVYRNDVTDQNAYVCYIYIDFKLFHWYTYWRIKSDVIVPDDDHSWLDDYYGDGQWG